MNQTIETSELASEKSVSQFSGHVSRLFFYIHDHSHSFRLELRGSLTADEIADLDGCWKTAESSVAGRKVQIDLKRISDIDSAGRKWLERMARIDGAEFVASPEFALDLPDGAVQTVETRAGEPSSSWCARLQSVLRGARKKQQASQKPSDSQAAQRLALDPETRQVPVA